MSHVQSYRNNKTDVLLSGTQDQEVMAQQTDTRCTPGTGGLPSHRGKLDMWVPKSFLEEENLSVRGRGRTSSRDSPHRRTDLSAAWKDWH